MIVCEKHLQIAEKIARQSNVKKSRVSCLALSNSGQIITFSSNRLLTGNHIKWSEHAEAAVLRKLRKLNAFNRFKDISLFVFRISSLGISMSKPCIFCQRFINKYPVTVYYTVDGGGIKRL